MTWSTPPQLPLAPPPPPPFACTCMMQHHFGAEFYKEEGYSIYSGDRGKRTHMFLWFLLFFYLLIKACKDSLYEVIWRLNLTPWDTQNGHGAGGGVEYEDLRKEFGSRTSFSSFSNWSNVPLVSLNLPMKFVSWKNCIWCWQDTSFMFMRVEFLVLCVLFSLVLHVFQIILPFPQSTVVKKCCLGCGTIKKH